MGTTRGELERKIEEHFEGRDFPEDTYEIVAVCMGAIDEFVNEQQQQVDPKLLVKGQRVRLNPLLKGGDGSYTDKGFTVTESMEDQLRDSDGWGTVGDYYPEMSFVSVRLDKGSDWHWDPRDIIEVGEITAGDPP